MGTRTLEQEIGALFDATRATQREHCMKIAAAIADKLTHGRAETGAVQVLGDALFTLLVCAC